MAAALANRRPRGPDVAEKVDRGDRQGRARVWIAVVAEQQVPQIAAGGVLVDRHGIAGRRRRLVDVVDADRDGPLGRETVRIGRPDDEVVARLSLMIVRRRRGERAGRRIDREPAAGIVDQVSFVVMRRLGLTRAFTNDWHFRAAGFETLF